MVVEKIIKNSLLFYVLAITLRENLRYYRLLETKHQPDRNSNIQLYACTCAIPCRLVRMYPPSPEVLLRVGPEEVVHLDVVLAVPVVRVVGWDELVLAAGHVTLQPARRLTEACRCQGLHLPGGQ